MKNNYKNIIKLNFPVIVLIVLIIVVAIVNYKPGTYLTGWDNLQVELNFKSNIIKNFQGVWQEYQGLGVVTGNAHGVEALRSLLLAIVDIFLPNSAVRYFYHFLMLGIGVISTFYLIRFFLKDKPNSQYFSLIGATYYLVSLGTVQNFYTPFEPFSSFYAFLPLGLFMILKYLENPSIKIYILLIFTLIITTFSFQVPTIFIVFMIFLFPFLLSKLLVKNSDGNEKKYKYKLNKHFFTTILTILIVNLFWLMPFIYYLTNNLDTRFSSLSTTLSTPNVISQQSRYANFLDISILRGFWFTNVDYNNITLQNDYMMSPWLEWYSNKEILIISIGIAILVWTGLIISFLLKIKYRVSLAICFLLSLFFLFGGNGPASIFYELLVSMVPVLGEAFRFSFTKWIVPIVLLYSIYLSISILGVSKIISGFAIKIKFTDKNRIILKSILTGLTIVILIFYSFPIFKGNMIYDRLRVAIPQDYFDFFKYINEKPDNGRLAMLPVNSIWGWRYYEWRYRGSGFIWYGINNPVLDRTFDVWSNYNEQFYNEFSYALYSRNINLIKYVLNKYQVKYLLLDKNVVAPDAYRSLFIEPTQQLLGIADFITLEQDFGNIFLYRVDLNENFSRDIYSSNTKYILDQNYDNAIIDSFYLKNAFKDDESYVTEESQENIIFPFLDDTKIKDLLKKPNDTLISKPTNINEDSVLSIPNFDMKSKLPAKVNLSSEGVSISYLFPKILNNYGEILYEKQITKNLPIEINPSDGTYILSNENVYKISQNLNTYLLGDNVSVISTNNDDYTEYVFSDYIYSATISDCYGGNGKYGKEYDKYPGSIILRAKDNNACLDFENIVEIPENSVIKVTFDYKTAPQTRPYYCLWSDTKQKCINQKYQNSPFESAEWAKYEDVIYLSKGEKLKFGLILEPDGQSDLQEVFYKNIKVITYPISKITSVGFIENDNKSDQNISLTIDDYPLKVVLPDYSDIDSSYLPGDKHFSREIQNCDTFNSGRVDRELIENGIDDKYVYSALSAMACDRVDTRNIDTHGSYIIEFDHNNLRGNYLDICLGSKNLDKCLIQDRLSAVNNSFLLPVYNLNDGVNLSIGNQSIGKNESINELSEIRVKYLPYSWLKGINLVTNVSGISIGNDNNINSVIDVKKLSTYKYKFSLVDNSFDNELLLENKAYVIILNQSYDKGWDIYDSNTCILGISTPFTCKKIQSKHLVAKNWANGWVIQEYSPGDYLIIFWPQYLQYAGYFVLLFFIFISIASTIIIPKTKH